MVGERAIGPNREIRTKIVFCGAKTRSGGQCQQPAMRNGRCRLHGGKALSGIAAPAFIHGRHTKYMPKGMLEKYQEYVSDPALLALNTEVAIADARISELIERLDAGGGGADAVKAVVKAFDLASDAAEEVARDPDFETIGRLKETMQDLGAAIGAMSEGDGLWKEIEGWLDTRRKLARTETQRIAAAHNVYTADQVMALCAHFVALVKENVSDRSALQGIQSGINRLVAANSMGPQRAGPPE